MFPRRRGGVFLHEMNNTYMALLIPILMTLALGKTVFAFIFNSHTRISD